MAADLTYEGCNFYRQRLVLSTLSGKSVRIKNIRSFDDDPGLKGMVCGKPSYGNMICPFPNLTRTVTAHLQAELSFSLDAVTTWEVFSGYPKFKSMTIVPDPIITKFDGVFVLKTPTLEIK
ncbi:RNA 3 -terminal phosphate cyclase, partial [Paramuricea clavata]